MLSVLAIPRWHKTQSQHASQTVLQYAHNPEATIKNSSFIKFVRYTFLHFRNNKLTAQAVEIIKLVSIHGLTCIKKIICNFFFLHYVQLMKTNVLIRFSYRRTEAQHFYACINDEYYSSDCMKDYRLSAGKQKKKAFCLATRFPIYFCRDRFVYTSHLQGPVKNFHIM